MTYNVTWRLTIDTPHADTLQQALAPETDTEHATLSTKPDCLIIEGHGNAGQCQHALDDILACLTGTLAMLDLGDASNAQ